MIGRLAFLGATALTLSGCVETAAPAMVDTGAEQCRQQGASVMQVGLDRTTAARTGDDAFGNQNYNVVAAGMGFSCTLDASGQVVSFNRM